MAPTVTGRVGQARVELWDADDFDPWETLRWSTVRVIRYRQQKPNGTVVQADWLTAWPTGQVSALALYRMATYRWELETQGFNDAKTRYGMAHICHHQANSVLVSWLLLALALTIERLYRQRYRHRGTHPVYPAITLVRLLWLRLGLPHAQHDPGCVAHPARQLHPARHASPACLSRPFRSARRGLPSQAVPDYETPHPALAREAREVPHASLGENPKRLDGPLSG